MTSTLPPAKKSFEKSPEAIAQGLFFGETGIHSEDALSWVKKSLNHADDGELYGEYTSSESLSLVDGVIRNSSFDTSQGFGLRSVLGEQVNYAHTSALTPESLKGLSDTIFSANKGHQGALSLLPSSSPKALYTSANPLDGTTFDQRVSLLKQIDAYTRDLDPRVSQVIAKLAAAWKVVMIMRPEGHILYDVRPMARLNVTVVVSDKGRQESGYYGGGGRKDLSFACDSSNWQPMCDEAVRQAVVNLDSIPAPAGPMPVVMSNGWGGVLLHEAIGHGLEGDAIRKKTSVYADKLGQQITMPGVTVVDDGTISERRGSLTIDDEGTPTQRNVLIEDGYLKKFMQDRLNGRLSGGGSSGNGRRESYTHVPIPRMTNTMMLGGEHTKEDIISSVDRGFYAAHMGGGQVDIASGKFVFEVAEGYLIEKGKIGAPVKGATLIGDGLQVLQKLSMIGNDAELDPGIGTCGKAGQMVPVGVGQPTVLVSSITVGGTESA
ncbi:MAG: metalloprotease TldD [bacterium]|nr:metalloprotease TldD [bacterium]